MIPDEQGGEQSAEELTGKKRQERGFANPGD